MAQNILEITQDVCDEIGIESPTTLVSNSDELARQLRSLMRYAARTLMLYDWQALTKEATFTSVANQESQVADIYIQWSDLLRILPDTMFNRTEQRKIFGAITPQGWASAQASITTTPEYHFRLRGNALLFFGNRPSGDNIYFEYISRNWLTNAARDTFYSNLNADTDIPLLDDYALQLGVKYRLLRANGVEYSEAYNDYVDHVRQLRAADLPPSALDLTPTSAHSFGQGFVPEGSWDVP